MGHCVKMLLELNKWEANMVSKMYKVEFFSLSANKHVTKSKHKTLRKAVEKARKAYLDHPCNISILCPDGQRLNRYGSQRRDDE
jgi:hypothetical protein